MEISAKQKRVRGSQKALYTTTYTMIMRISLFPLCLTVISFTNNWWIHILSLFFLFLSLSIFFLLIYQVPSLLLIFSRIFLSHRWEGRLESAHSTISYALHHSSPLRSSTMLKSIPVSPFFSSLLSVPHW